MRNRRMPALRTIALVVMAVWGSAGHAAGLGPVRVQSSLGQPLRVSMPLLGDDASGITANCVKARVENADGGFIATAAVAFRNLDQSTTIQLSTREGINEPAVMVRVEVACGASIKRNYQVLLDPVVILPELASSDPQSASAASPNRRALQELPYVAPSTAASRVSETRRRTSRNRRDNTGRAPAPISVEVDGASQSGMARSSRSEPKTVMRSVLRLSSDDVAVDGGATFSPGLKLTDTLSESRDTGDPAQAAELRAAHARFAAILRDEDPIQNSEAQLQAMQTRLQNLEKQAALIQESSELQRKADQLAMESMFSGGWIAGLAGLLLSALAAIGWLAWRLREASRKPPTAFWEKTIVSDEELTDEWGNTLSYADTLSENRQASSAKNASPADDPHTDWDPDALSDNTQVSDTQASEEPVQQAAHSDTVSDKVKPAIAPVAPDAAGKTAAGQAISASPKTDKPVQQRAAETPPSAAKPVLERAPLVTPAQVRRSDEMHLLQVEEISDLMQEAEFWMLLNDSERAIAILEPYAEVKNPLSPVPWIYLLDLYRAVGAREKYDALGWRITKVFNTRVPSWNEEVDYASARSLQDYPHVQEAVLDLWEGDYIVPYLESLLFDDRDGLRTGFDLPVYRELIHLIALARDPNTIRKRETLVFEKSRPRLISQQVVAVPEKQAGSAAKPLTIARAAETNLTSQASTQQAAAKQPLPKISPTDVAVKEDEPKTAAPVIAPASMQPATVPETKQAAPVPVPPATVAAPVSVPAPASLQTAVALENVAILQETPQAAAEPEDAGDEIGEVAAAKTGDDLRIDMARKLDLAVAYQEIGENVGARVLLEEVIQGGTPIQAEKAKTRLKKLLKDIDWQ